MTLMPYVAGRRMEMADGTVREIGEPVPEVDDWPNPRPWIESGHVVFVETLPGDEKRKSPTKAQRARSATKRRAPKAAAAAAKTAAQKGTRAATKATTRAAVEPEAPKAEPSKVTKPAPKAEAETTAPKGTTRASQS